MEALTLSATITSGVFSLENSLTVFEFRSVAKTFRSLYPCLARSEKLIFPSFVFWWIIFFIHERKKSPLYKPYLVAILKGSQWSSNFLKLVAATISLISAAVYLKLSKVATMEPAEVPATPWYPPINRPRARLVLPRRRQFQERLLLWILNFQFYACFVLYGDLSVFY